MGGFSPFPLAGFFCEGPNSHTLAYVSFRVDQVTHHLVEVVAGAACASSGQSSCPSAQGAQKEQAQFGYVLSTLASMQTYYEVGRISPFNVLVCTAHPIANTRLFFCFKVVQTISKRKSCVRVLFRTEPQKII